MRTSSFSRILLVVMLVVVLAAAALPQGRALACGCFPSSAPLNLMNYDFVFTGQTNDPPEISEGEGQTVHRYTLSIKKVWKGTLGPTVVVESIVTSCGVTFEPGMEYLVYANPSSFGHPGVISADPCTTSAAAFASGDLAFLDGAPFAGGVGAVLLVLVVVLIALRMRRRKLSPPAPG